MEHNGYIRCVKSGNLGRIVFSMMDRLFIQDEQCSGMITAKGKISKNSKKEQLNPACVNKLKEAISICGITFYSYPSMKENLFEHKSMMHANIDVMNKIKL